MGKRYRRFLRGSEPKSSARLRSRLTCLELGCGVIGKEEDGFFLTVHACSWPFFRISAFNDVLGSFRLGLACYKKPDPIRLVDCGKSKGDALARRLGRVMNGNS